MTSIFANKEEREKFEKKTNWTLWILLALVIALASCLLFKFLPQIKQKMQSPVSEGDSSSPQAQKSSSATIVKQVPAKAPIAVDKKIEPPAQVEMKAENKTEKEAAFPPGWTPEARVPPPSSTASSSLPVPPATSSVATKKDEEKKPEVKKEKKQIPQVVAGSKKTTITVTPKQHKDQFFAWMPDEKKKTERCLVDRPISVIPSECSSILVHAKRKNESYDTWVMRGLASQF